MSERRSFLCALIVAAGLLLPGFAHAAGPAPAKLSDQDRADVGRIEKYLNGIDTLSSKFLQFASDGSYSQGMLYVSRPGKMRIEYDPPTPVLIVATGVSLVYYDTQLQQVSYLPLGQSPAAVILREKIDLFGKDILIRKFEHGPEVQRLTVSRSEDPLEGSITLVFSTEPLVLKKWVVVDAQGTETTVSLHGTRFGVGLDPELFVFRDPNFIKPAD